MSCHFLSLSSTLISLHLAAAAAHLLLVPPPSCLLCWLDVLYPLVCGMHAFKGTTEQIRGPSLCTNSLSFISDGDWRASVPWRIVGPSVAPAALRASQCFHRMGAGPWPGPPQVPLPRTLVSGVYSRWKSTQSLPAALVSSRSCVSVPHVLGLASFEKTWQ